MRPLLALAVILAVSACSPRLRCKDVDGTEVCAAKPVCRDTKSGRFVKCPGWFVDCSDSEAAK